MAVQLSSPTGLMPAPYHHVSVATGSRLIHVAGQVARDGDGRALANGDLAGQVAGALRNVGRALAGAGATFADVAQLRFYVARWQPEMMADLMAGIEAVLGALALPQPLPPSSLIGVDRLYEPDVLVEVEATAVVE